MMIKEAIVLAGGLGTRLKGVISEIPKPMAPIGDKPFLEYVLNYLKAQQIERVILAVGYKFEVIQDYFGESYNGIELVYAIENTPMGTGGGIANALKHTNSHEVFLLNGDTFFQVDLHQLCEFHSEHQSDLTLSLKQLNDFDRYGTVDLDQGRVTQFKEKKYLKQGAINGGVYVLNRKIFEQPELGDKFSFEQDIMERCVDSIQIYGISFDGYFIDIGIPEDYAKAQIDLPDLKF